MYHLARLTGGFDYHNQYFNRSPGAEYDSQCEQRCQATGVARPFDYCVECLHDIPLIWAVKS